MTSSPSGRASLGPLPIVLAPAARLLLIALVAAGILYNNVLRWYPFAAGFSVNDLTGLESNLAGIVINVAIYGSLLVGVLCSGASALLAQRSMLIQSYCLYLAIQAPFRSDPVNEVFRSFAMISMLLSADWLATVVIGSRGGVEFIRRMWWALVTSIFIGLVIGVVLDDSVNWGQGLSPSFKNQYRAEFFFFYVLPQYGFALSVSVLVATFKRPGVQFVVAGAATIIIAVLVGRTMTRTMIFSLLLIVVVFLARYARKTLGLGVAAIILAAAQWPEVIRNGAASLRVAELFAGDRTVDATNGRLFLVLTNLQSFADAPVVGQGAVVARQRVEDSGSIARSEHGYSIHLASSGIFALLLFGFVLQGAAAGIRIVWHWPRRPGGTHFGPFGLGIAALALASFGTGFFWTFSSATSFYDWAAVFFMSSARALWDASSSRSAGLDLVGEDCNPS